MKPRAVGVVFADQVKTGDVIFASYARPIKGTSFSAEFARKQMGRDDELVCAWVVVGEIKHHTDTTVTMFSNVYDDLGSPARWVEYPLDAPLVIGVPDEPH